MKIKSNILIFLGHCHVLSILDERVRFLDAVVLVADFEIQVENVLHVVSSVLL